MSHNDKVAFYVRNVPDKCLCRAFNCPPGRCLNKCVQVYRLGIKRNCMKFVWPRQPREIDNSSTLGHVKLCSIREDMFSSMASYPWAIENYTALVQGGTPTMDCKLLTPASDHLSPPTSFSTHIFLCLMYPAQSNRTVHTTTRLNYALGSRLHWRNSKPNSAPTLTYPPSFTDSTRSPLRPRRRHRLPRPVKSETTMLRTTIVQ